MTCNFTPTNQQLQELKTWLKAEEDLSQSGFFCNWDTIEKAFKKSCLIVFIYNNEIVGFLSWSTFSAPYVYIDIMEIHPNHRKKGFGKRMFEACEIYFKNKEFLAMILCCEPRESEAFWRKMCFTKFPPTGYTQPDLKYYKPLIEVNELIDSYLDIDDKLELWDVEPYEIYNVPPRWTWLVNKNSPPILQPCNGDWNLRLTKNGVIIKEDKVKYFSDDYGALSGEFLSIDTKNYF